MGIVNSLIASFIDETQVCEALGGGLLPGTLSCGDCVAEIVPEGLFQFKTTVEASCSLGDALTVTLAGESDTVNFWEPFIGGGIGVFDPFKSTLTISPNLGGVASAAIEVEAESSLFTDPPTFDVTSTTGSATVAGVTADCVATGTQLECLNAVCFDTATFAFALGSC